MNFGRGHVFTKLAGVVQCARCGARVNWPLALSTCKGAAAKLVAKDVVGLTEEEIANELRRSLDMGRGDPTYAFHHPNGPYGRDGRRRNGIGN